MPRRSPSSIHRLPPEVRVELESLFADKTKTLDDLVELMEARGHEISRSAMGRARKRFDAVAEKLTEMREVASSFARELGEIPEGDAGRLVIEMVQTIMFKFAMSSMESGEDEGPPLGAEELMLFARSIRDLTAAQKSSADLEMKIRDRVQKETAERARAAADEAVSEARDAGLSDAAAEAIRKRIMGIAEAA